MGIRLSGLSSGMDIDSMVGALMYAQSLKKTKVERKKTKLEWKQTKWKDLNTKLTSLYNNHVSKMRLQSTYLAKKATLSDTSKATVSASNTAVNGSYTMEIKGIASAQYLTSAKINATSTNTKLVDVDSSLLNKEIEIKANGKTSKLTISESTTINDFTKTLKDAGLNASYDTAQKRFFISSKNTGLENSFSISSSALSSLGLADINVAADGTVSVNGGANDGTNAPAGMALIEAADSTIILNGAELTSSSTTVSANGLNISLTGKTKTDEPISFTVDNDVDSVYKQVKDFLKEYNSVLSEMYKMYNADSAKNYEPLTSEQKEAMSDKEVEEWETKIKDSLLRRDDRLNRVMQGMRDAMMSVTEVDGKKYALSSFGIMTSMNYTEGGQLHIYGDPDDSVYSGEKDKLKEALAKDPQGTTKALSDIFENLRSSMSNMMKMVPGYSSALTFYDDIKMEDDMKSQKKEVEAWEDKLAEMEERYYKKFTAMETAMAKLQSQQSSLAGIFGSGS